MLLTKSRHTKQNAFTWMTGNLTKIPTITITEQQYAEFKRQWVLDALRGYRYGQAFCLYFKLDANIPIYWFKDNKIAEDWIKHNYLAE
jgi:hypothetical protein